MAEFQHRENISDYALGLAKDIKYWPETAARQLGQILTNELETVRPNKERDEKLGLLIDLALDGHDLEALTADEYDAHQKREKEAGRSWVTSSTLSKAYGGKWDQACDMAQRVVDGGAHGVSVSGAHWGRKVLAYTHADIHDALIRCYREIGRWPRPTEYEDWAKLQRRADRRNGVKNPKWLPWTQNVRKVCGSWERASEQAQKELARREKARDERTNRKKDDDE